MGNIQTIVIAMKGAGKDELYEPPERVLHLSVVGNECYLSVHDLIGPKEFAAEASASFVVPAQSLLRGLTVAVQDAAAEDDD